jgi:sigma-B regulation protein RsbU (phosphoserine phosphatase)
MPSRHRTKPALEVIHGEFPGRIYPLEGDINVIGRDLRCQVVLSRKFVSRKHARILRGPSGFEIEDLESNCGTFVEGVRIRSRVPLRDRFQIKIGNYSFVFHLPEILVTDSEESGSTILGTLDATRPAGAGESSVRPEEKLRHVLEITRKLGESLALADVLEKTLESLFKIFPQADRGFVLLREGAKIDFTPRAIRFRGQETGNLTISRTILKHVLEDCQGILSSDTTLDDRFDECQSVLGTIRMMICVPLIGAGTKGQPQGILQLDTHEERGTFTRDDLDLLFAVAGQVCVAVENARLHARLIEQTQVEQESQDARDVQMALLPERTPELPGYSFWDCYEPAQFVGGDYFDYLPQAVPEPQGESAPRRWVLAVGDVAGKGMAAAILMARLSAEVRLFTLTTSEPTRIVERLNRDFCLRAIGSRFITLLLVLVDADTHQMHVVSAGHAGPMIRRGDRTVEVIGEGTPGPPLGVTEGAVYVTTTTTLEPGDMVLLYTDGLIDATDAANRRFGIDRLRQLLALLPLGASHVGEAIISAVRQHATGAPSSDDITFLCFERRPEPVELTTS